MMQNFDQMPENSKIWIYQAPRKLEPNEQQFIDNELSSFVSNWESHGSKVDASYKVLNDIFVIIVVNEAKTIASGCSIDKSIHIIEKIAKSLKLDFFIRTNVAYATNGGILIDKLKNFKNLISEGKIDENTLIFNNTITLKGQLDNNWKIKAKDSWLKQFFPSSVQS